MSAPCPGRRVIAAPLLAALLGVAVLPVMAQRADLAAIEQAMRRNREALAAWTWTSRIEVRLAGEVRQVATYRTTQDAHGVVRREPLVAQDARPRRARSGTRKTAARIDRLTALLDSYLVRAQSELGAGDVQVVTGAGPSAGRLGVKLRDVVRAGDSLELWVDQGTKRPRRLEIVTSLDGEGVRLTTEFEDQDDGPTFPARSVLRTEAAREKPWVLTVESYALRPR